MLSVPYKTIDWPGGDRRPETGELPTWSQNDLGPNTFDHCAACGRPFIHLPCHNPLSFSRADEWDNIWLQLHRCHVGWTGRRGWAD